MSEEEKYVKHSIGITGMLSWIMRWQQYKEAIIVENGSNIKLSLLPSSRFGLVFPLASAYGKIPFLVMQNEELAWFKDIEWNRVMIKKGDPRLYFISEKIKGFNYSMPDLHAFSFSVEFDYYEKIESLFSCKKIGLKNIWFDELGEAHIPKGKHLAEITVFNNKKDQPVLSESETSTHKSQEDDILRMMEENDRYNNYAFIGEESAVEDSFSHLLQGAKSKEAVALLKDEHFDLIDKAIVKKGKKRIKE